MKNNALRRLILPFALAAGLEGCAHRTEVVTAEQCRERMANLLSEMRLEKEGLQNDGTSVRCVYDRNLTLAKKKALDLATQDLLVSGRHRVSGGIPNGEFQYVDDPESGIVCARVQPIRFEHNGSYGYHMHK